MPCGVSSANGAACSRDRRWHAEADAARALAGLAVVVAAGVVVVALSGWNAKGTVTGKVTFKGKPLPNGLVVFVDSDDNRYPALIERDGSYTTRAKLPCRSMKVIVGTSPNGNVNLVLPEPSMFPVSHVPIPRHYAAPDKSGLAIDVRRGLQVFTIDLNDDFEPDELSMGTSSRLSPDRSSDEHGRPSRP
jgi:hypothetical protein